MGKRPVTRSLASSSPGSSCVGPGRPKAGPPPRRSFISSATDFTDGPGNESSNSREHSEYFGHIPSDDFAAQDAGYDADVEIVRPYAIEEPDDETDQTPTSAHTPNLPEASENWQKELVNSLRDLYCDSDSNDPHPLVRQKRGRKRKPDTSMAPSQSLQDIQSQSVKDRGVVDTRVGGMVFSPKRRRKKSAHAREDIRASHNSPLAGDDASIGSSPVVLSTGHYVNGKSNTPRRDMSAIDRMDMD